LLIFEQKCNKAELLTGRKKPVFLSRQDKNNLTRAIIRPNANCQSWQSGEHVIKNVP